MTDDKLAAFIKKYLAQGTRLHHPGYMSHQCAVPDIGSAPNDSAAILVHGGSLANLTALLVARHHTFPEAWQHGTPQNAVLLAPANAHVSVTQAAAILGIGSRAICALPCDRFGRIVGAQVSESIKAHHRAGRTVMAVVANACAAPTGLFDPLQEIAHICHNESVWLHVDAAHGGSALLVPELRHRLKGIDQADSITWDAHKMLRTSTLAAAVLVRTAADLS